MDALANSNHEKTNQITTLKNELKLLKEQVELQRKESRPVSTACHSHKNSLDAVIIPTQLSRDRGKVSFEENRLRILLLDSKPASRRSEGTEHRYSDIHQKKQTLDNYGNEKKLLSSTGSRGMFSSTEWNGKSTEYDFS